MRTFFDIEFDEGTGPDRRLVVLGHGLARMLLASAPRVVREAMPDADILIPRYRTRWYSNADAVRVAGELSEIIQAQCSTHERTASRPYRDLVLVGHSMGAVLLRKAFVFARGQSQELQAGGLNRARQPWAGQVSRMVLLAGMNRGWSLHPRPPRMPLAKVLFLRAADKTVAFLHFANFLREIRRGSPFIVNLRIQWINLIRAGEQMPLVVQILGQRDDVVHADDNIDLQAGYNFVYKQAPPGTDHANVVDMTHPARRSLFIEALVTPAARLTSDYVVPQNQKPDPSIDHVIFLIHGIRDYGNWTHRFAEAIRVAGAARGRKIVAVRPSYGYFPMLRFLLVSERQKKVRWFMDQYTEALAKYSRASIDFVGHSNGTYLLASALSRYPACAFNRAVFAGSVVPRDFPWDQIVRDGRIAAIRNYVASADKVVGVFPGFFERFGGDVGSAGLLGFTREPAVQLEWQYVAGGHSAAINDQNFPSIATFLIDGLPSSPPQEIVASSHDPLTLLLTKLNWAVWILLLLAIAATAWLVAFVWAPLLPYIWLRLILFFLLIFAILNTI